MKRGILFLLFIFFQLPSFAQSDYYAFPFYRSDALQLLNTPHKEQPIRDHWNPSDYLPQRFISTGVLSTSTQDSGTFTYNANCSLRSSGIVFSGDQPIQTVYNYNPRFPHLINQEIIQRWNGTSWSNEIFNLYDYDIDGSLKSYKRFQSTEGKLDTIQSVTFINQYKAPQLIQQTTVEMRLFHDTASSTTTRYDFHYNAFHRLQCINEWKKKNGVWKLAGRDTLLQFDYFNSPADWQLISMVEQEHDGAGWHDAFRLHFRYDKNGSHFISEEIQRENSWQPWYSTYELHDDEGNIASKKTSFRKNDLWEVRWWDSTLNIYDDRGALMRQKIFYWDSNNKELTLFLTKKFYDFKPCEPPPALFIPNAIAESISPNITSGFFNVRYHVDHTAAPTMLSIQNVFETEVYHQLLNPREADNSLNLTLAPFPEGVYCVKLLSEKQVAYSTVIVKR